jgi:hypothetical protein
MGGFNRDIGVGIAIALRSQNYAKLHSRQNKRRVIKYKVNGAVLIASSAAGFRASRRLIQAML